MKIKSSLITIIFASIIIAVSLSAYSASVQHFVLGMEDVPLFPGLEEDADASSVYDTETGRIVDSIYFSKNLVGGDLVKFYDDSLPQLGWEKIEMNESNLLAYKRANEKLEISFSKNDESGKFVRFFLYPF